MLLPITFRKIITTAQASAAICAILFSDPRLSSADTLQTFHGETPAYIAKDNTLRLGSCSAKSNCVSSNYKEPPNRYVSPLKIVNDRDVSFQRAIRDLKQNPGGVSIVEIVPKDYYIHLTVPGTAPSSVDDIELIFADDIVNVKCEARVTLPPPPFCVQKNCINGNMDQRSRIENLAYSVLGLPPSDREQMQGAKWTPIFFNADRVPGFGDEF
jgi:uncharacterized protein (DUF1499 family)